MRANATRTASMRSLQICLLAVGTFVLAKMLGRHWNRHDRGRYDECRGKSGYRARKSSPAAWKEMIEGSEAQ
ncbi:hypothetical protein JDV02_003124 [Purpureocillium takamizusanense]|uniref:Uncharacterized protein n=1 Tax=Purpureocillium takamizusanense TaxID=2060973 RepID=A0A9Q8QBT4_9HYPO|nr:uncharacterized protein JDV02_003124 [Purpureocillium takamizusanense]UNI16710.1 hypothetical protein JDV02_003124 [Purpureocillium takamizusanense]